MRVLFALMLTSALTLPAAAQPQLSNGELRLTPMTGRLTLGAIEALAPRDGVAWVGYAVPAVEGEQRSCCWSSDTTGCCQTCRLEPGGDAPGGNRTVSGGTTVVSLEAPRLLHVLFRMEAGRVDRLRVFSEDCALDAGARTLHWLTGVTPEDSVTVLASFLSAGAPRQLADHALTALALHREPAALERLLATARTGATTHQRGQALFWLAQRAGDQAVGAITDAIARDPETAVKRQAVFALSQLPRDEGVPLLIDVARKHANPAVRRQAMFWLGQSKDPRAIKFFEEILFK